MIKAVLIDIDNTLLDFIKAAYISIKSAFNSFGFEYDQNMHVVFNRVNDGLWKDIEACKLTREELHKIRFNLVLKELGIEFDGQKIEKEFLKNLFDCVVIVDGAVEILEYLAGKYDVYVASNAIYDQQVNRLTKAGMIGYIKKLFISERMGVYKPEKAFFDACFKELGGITPDQVVMIGDSINADIKGGKNYGMKTIWFNFKGEKEPDEKPYDYVVDKLLEIRNIL